MESTLRRGVEMLSRPRLFERPPCLSKKHGGQNVLCGLAGPWRSVRNGRHRQIIYSCSGHYCIKAHLLVGSTSDILRPMKVTGLHEILL